MSLRRKLAITVIVVYSVLAITWDHYLNKHPSQVMAGNWHASLAPKNGDSSSLHHLTYEAVITNEGDLSDTVKEVRVILNGVILPRIQSGDNQLAVNKRLGSHETFTIYGDFLVDTTGSTDAEIMKGGSIQRFEVEVKPRGLFNW